MAKRGASKVFTSQCRRALLEAVGEFAQEQAQGMSSAGARREGIAKAFMDLYARMRPDPRCSRHLEKCGWTTHAMAIGLEKGARQCAANTVPEAARAT